jgi:hypothetical protein
MISFSVVFYLFILLTGFIGLMRGWAKEILVTISALFAIFIILILETYFGGFQEFVGNTPTSVFWTKTAIILFLAFFGYQTPKLSRFAPAVIREQARDSILGGGLGAINGYFIVGSIWYYLNAADYPFSDHMLPPMAEKVIELVAKMPPAWIEIPGIYFAIAIAFIFIAIVFI